MNSNPPSLEHYARRRLSLAGGAMIADRNPYSVPTDRLAEECAASGLEFLSFAHYDYLSVAQDQRVRFAAIKAVQKLGSGAGASRLVGGERLVHRELESKLATFVGTESALAMVSGYGTNLALVGHLLTTGDLILVDELAHNSIISGTKLSRAETRTFRHNDLTELATVLSSIRSSYRRVLVIVEGLYSMDGDVPDLPLLLELAKQYNFWTMIDEAHSIGVLGRTGRGICEHFGVPAGEVDLIVGTLSKSLAACGGFICAREPVIEWLRYSLPGYVYSVGIPPPTAAAVCTALALISRESERVARLHATSAYFISTARRLGFDVGKAIGIGVVPIIFKDTEAAFLASEALLASGIYAPPIVQLGIPKDMPRLRFFLSASHTTADIDRVFDVLSAWRELPGETGLRSSPLESQIRGLALAETELDTFPAQPHAHR